MTACLEVAAEKKPDLARLVEPERGNKVALRTQTTAFPEKLQVLGFKERLKDGTPVPTEEHNNYALDFVARVAVSESAEVPYAYLVPAGETAVIENLQRHGIAVEELREDVALAVAGLVVSGVEVKEAGFPKKHRLTEVSGRWVDGTRPVPAGTVVVKTAQPRGALAAHLLEPRSEDGLTAWGLFNGALAPGKGFPVLRLTKGVPLALGPAPKLPEARRANQPVTEAQLLTRGGAFTFGFAGAPLTQGAWIDGDHFLQVKEGKLLRVEARTGKGEPFTDPEKIKASLAALKGLDAAAVDRIAGGTAFRTNPARTAFLVDLGDDIGVAYFGGQPGARLTNSKGAKEHVTWSPDGKRVAFVHARNLFAASVAQPGAVHQLTNDSAGDVSNAKADWVYEEEVFNRDGRAYWWSPDGGQIAFLRFDDAPVKKFNLVDLKDAQGRLESYAYPKPGDPNPLVKIGVVSADGSAKPDFLEMGGYKPDETIIARVGWVGGSRRVYAYVQNRTQTWLDFVTWNQPRAGPQVLFRETTMAWVDDPGEPHWLPDGSFLFPSERTGWKHLYHYAAGGKLLAPVTTGEWEVRDVVRVDARDKTVYFTAGYTSPTGTDLCRVTVGKGTELLTEKGKSHRVSLAPTGGLFIDRFTDAMTPTRSNLVEAGAGVVRKLDTNPVRERDE
ncbi:MAG: DPP IV N-terminal domain-containing protein, partial [Gemmata sp.]